MDPASSGASAEHLPRDQNPDMEDAEESHLSSNHQQNNVIVIKSIQETFADSGLSNNRIHATGWQAFCKIAENAFNNIPIAYTYSRSQENTELLKIITPNMLHVGRINSKALQGPIGLHVDKKELMELLELTYKG